MAGNISIQFSSRLRPTKQSSKDGPARFKRQTPTPNYIQRLGLSPCLTRTIKMRDVSTCQLFGCLRDLSVIQCYPVGKLVFLLRSNMLGTHRHGLVHCVGPGHRALDAMTFFFSSPAANMQAFAECIAIFQRGSFTFFIVCIILDFATAK